jgi:hypothetical protein
MGVEEKTKRIVQESSWERVHLTFQLIWNEEIFLIGRGGHFLSRMISFVEGNPNAESWFSFRPSGEVVHMWSSCKVSVEILELVG